MTGIDAAMVRTALTDVAPALAFLCLGVPYAALLDRLGAFDAFISWFAARRGDATIGALWVLCTFTTALLNLDTTIVLLTPISVRLARRSGHDPFVVAAVPLLLSGLASSFLPVSNLTTLLAQGSTGLSTTEVVTTSGPAGAVAVCIGWLVFRPRAPRRLHVDDGTTPDPAALRWGAGIVATTVVGFVAGPWVGVEPWVVLVVVDAVLAARLRRLPWRDVPLGTAVVVAALVAAVAATGRGPGDALIGDGAASAGAAALVGATVANLINNLPATILGLGSVTTMTDGAWGWLWGVNAGSLLLPWGTLATVLWWRVLRSEGVAVDLRSYLRTVVPVALPAFLAGTVALVATLMLR